MASMAGSSASEVLFISVNHSITLMGEFTDRIRNILLNCPKT